VRSKSRGKLRGVHRQRALQLFLRESQEEELMPAGSKSEGRPPIKLLLSAFEGRPAVLLFDYHPAVGKERTVDPDRVVSCEGHGRPEIFFSHSGCVHRYNAVLNSFYCGGLEEEASVLDSVVRTVKGPRTVPGAVLRHRMIPPDTARHRDGLKSGETGNPLLGGFVVLEPKSWPEAGSILLVCDTLHQ
ncbi:unnamed protein product, partial [Durusdinium trenchii]